MYILPTTISLYIDLFFLLNGNERVKEDRIKSYKYILLYIIYTNIYIYIYRIIHIYFFCLYYYWYKYQIETIIIIF